MKEKLKSGFFILSLLLILLLAANIVVPYASYVFVAIIIAFTLRPVYLWLLKIIRRPTLTTLLMLGLIFLFIFVPLIFISTAIIERSSSTISSINREHLAQASNYLSNHLNREIDLNIIVNEGLIRVQDFMLRESFAVLGQIAEVVIGLVIMFFIMFYLFKEGHEISQAIIDILPLKSNHKHVLLDEIMLVSNAVIYGQVITSLIQGAVATIGFLIFGIPNPILWGIVTMIVSFLPVIGTPVVFIPAGILQIVSGDTPGGIGILLFGFIFIMNIDDIVKPMIISEKSRLNPALILLGVFGGLHTFGFVGFILGPIVLSLLLVFLKVFRQDFKPSEELTKARKENEGELIVPLRIRPPDGHRLD